MEYTKYNKTMVLLSEENRDFAAKREHAIYGNLRMETGNNKGAISLSVQNLRFFERNRYIYKLILFGEKKERTIHAVMGTLILNRFGAGENYFRFDPNNVDGKGGKLDDYAVAIIAAVSMRDNKEPLHPILKGRLVFSGSNVMAAGTEKISKKEEQNRGKKEEENISKNLNRKPEDKGTEKSVQENMKTTEQRDMSTLEQKSNSSSNNKHNENNNSKLRNERVENTRRMETIERNRENKKMEKVERMDRMENSNMQGRREPVRQSQNMNEKGILEDALDPSPYEVRNYVKKEKVTYNKFYNQYLKEICEKTAKSAEIYDVIVPFTKDKTRAQWKRIANVKNIPMVSPGAMLGATKYRHYIFGEDANMYYLGVPGRYISEEQPEEGKSGFVLWQPIVGAESLEATKADCSLENRMTAYGYWITAIEKNSGDIVDPV